MSGSAVGVVYGKMPFGPAEVLELVERFAERVSQVDLQYNDGCGWSASCTVVVDGYESMHLGQGETAFEAVVKMIEEVMS